MEWWQWTIVITAVLMATLGFAILYRGWIPSSRAAAAIVVVVICVFAATTSAIRQWFLELGWARAELEWLPAILFTAAFMFFAAILPPLLWEIARGVARNL